MKQVSLLRKPLAFEGRFTQIPNSWARDERIGFRAKGILLLLMSHQDGWRITLEHLAGDGPDGITAVRTAVQQLEDAGYLSRYQMRDDQNRIEGAEWVICDPFEKDALQLEILTENLTLENRMHKNTNSKNTKEHKDIPELFDEFWKAYPRKAGKGAAVTAYKKAIKKISAQELLDAAAAYGASPNLPEMQYIPHPATWLNGERWLDAPDAIAKKRNSTIIAEDIIMRAAGMAGRKEIE